MESLLDREIYIVPFFDIDMEAYGGLPDTRIIYKYMKNMKDVYEEDTGPRWAKTWNKEVQTLIYLFLVNFRSFSFMVAIPLDRPPLVKFQFYFYQTSWRAFC